MRTKKDLFTSAKILIKSADNVRALLDFPRLAERIDLTAQEIVKYSAPYGIELTVSEARGSAAVIEAHHEKIIAKLLAGHLDLLIKSAEQQRLAIEQVQLAQFLDLQNSLEQI